MTRIDQTWYTRPPGVPEHTSAGGVVARIENDRILIAFVRERGFNDCVLPKGHVEPGENIRETAIREIGEEAGLTDLILVDDLGIKERLDFRKKSWKKTHYFLFTTRQAEGTPTDTENHDLLIWRPLDGLPPIFWPEQRDLLETNRDRIVRTVTRGPRNPSR